MLVKRLYSFEVFTANYPLIDPEKLWSLVCDTSQVPLSMDFSVTLSFKKKMKLIENYQYQIRLQMLSKPKFTHCYKICKMQRKHIFFICGHAPCIKFKQLVFNILATAVVNRQTSTQKITEPM